MNAVTIWDDLTAEERAVITTAIEEGYLNGVIGDFLGTPSTAEPSGSSATTPMRSAP